MHPPPLVNSCIIVFIEVRIEKKGGVSGAINTPLALLIEEGIIHYL